MSLKTMISAADHYVITPMKNVGSTALEDLSNVREFTGRKVTVLTGSKLAGKITEYFITAVVLAVPYFFLPWQVVMGALGAYQISQLKLPMFELALSGPLFLEGALKFKEFFVANWAKRPAGYGLVRAGLSGHGHLGIAFAVIMLGFATIGQSTKTS
jgi:hypothetical protein